MVGLHDTMEICMLFDSLHDSIFWRYILIHGYQVFTSIIELIGVDVMNNISS